MLNGMFSVMQSKKSFFFCSPVVPISFRISNSNGNQIFHYARCTEACNEFAGPIAASLHTDNTASFEEMSQRPRAVGNTVSDLTGPRLESQTSRSRDERITTRSTS